MISITTGGSTAGTERFLTKMAGGDLFSNLDGLCQRGVAALRAATPVDSGLTAELWDYEIVASSTGLTIWFSNHNTINGFNVAVGLQYGHGTGTGGWVQGYDFINPALKGIFDAIADQVWKEVQRG